MMKHSLPAGAAIVAGMLCTLAGTSTALAEPPPASYETVVTGNISYGGDPADRFNYLDIYQPVTTRSRPVVMFVHGGAWSSGDKVDYITLGQCLSSYYGFVTVVINYHLSPEVQHPVHVQDTAMAAAWVLDNIADYGGDPDLFFLMGHSAGGHLVSLLATDEQYAAAEGFSTTDITGVLSYSGVYNVDAFLPAALGSMSDVFACRTPSCLYDASPATHVDDWQPPFLVAYAEEDITTLSRQAKTFYTNLRTHQSHAQLQEFAGFNHVTEIGAISVDYPFSGPAAAVGAFVDSWSIQASLP